MNYLMESVTLGNKIRQYIQIVKSNLVKILEEISKVQPLSEDQKALALLKSSEIFSKSLDYTKRSNRKELFRQLNTPLIKLETDMNLDRRLCEGEEVSSILKKITNFVNKFTPTRLDPMQISKFLKTTAISISLIVLSGLVIKIVREAQKDIRFKKIADSYINPVAESICKGIILGKIKSEYDINRYLSDMESAINLKFADELN